MFGFSGASLGTIGALYPSGVRPANHIGEIVSKSQKYVHLDIKTLPNGLAVSKNPTVVTIDSGACEAVCPQQAFPYTHICSDTIEYGKCYGACGGETVRNMGQKDVGFVSGSGTIHKYDFQVGDKITKPLLAVSKICESKKGVFFGPAPRYEPYIIDDPPSVYGRRRT